MKVLNKYSKTEVATVLVHKLFLTGNKYTQSKLARLCNVANVTIDVIIRRLRQQFDILIARDGNQLFYVTLDEQLPDSYDELMPMGIPELQDTLATSSAYKVVTVKEAVKKTDSKYVLLSPEGYYAGKSKYAFQVTADVQEAIVFLTDRACALLQMLNSGQAKRWQLVNTKYIGENYERS